MDRIRAGARRCEHESYRAGPALARAARRAWSRVARQRGFHRRRDCAHRWRSGVGWARAYPASRRSYCRRDRGLGGGHRGHGGRVCAGASGRVARDAGAGSGSGGARCGHVAHASERGVYVGDHRRAIRLDISCGDSPGEQRTVACASVTVRSTGERRVSVRRIDPSVEPGGALGWRVGRPEPGAPGPGARELSRARCNALHPRAHVEGRGRLGGDAWRRPLRRWGGGFADVHVPRRSIACPPAVPPWTPPRADLLRLPIGEP